ncbi:MAG TPA: hypothetical protein VFB30_13655, partial [Spirochaetia bacterium]|nr:hypothetical protein [Spirochaetia bacterium]
MKNTPRHVSAFRGRTNAAEYGSRANAAEYRSRANAAEYRSRAFLDLFVLSGFIAGFFYGFLNPLYISVILSRLDTRVIALGSFMSSAFPVLIGLVLGNKKIFGKLYTALPAVMLVELAAAFGSALVAAVDLMAYYLVSMFVLGVFSSSVVFLLQKIKEVRYRSNRAAFDRRCEMADALGLLTGSVLSVAGFSLLRDTLTIALLGSLQTVVVSLLFILLYRRVPARRKRRADEEPHPWDRAKPRRLVSALNPRHA